MPLTVFAKIIDTDTHQVLFYKDWEEDAHGERSYQICARVEVFEGTTQSCAFGYKSEDKRNQKFTELNYAFAEQALNLMRAPFEEQATTQEGGVQG